MKYFAYGVNMYTPYFKQNVSEVKIIGIAKINGYQLRFNKLGYHDHSGKCNIVSVKDDTQAVYGVLYEITAEDRYRLDQEEGLGYGIQDRVLKVYPELPLGECGDSEGVYAFTYIAHKDRVRDNLLPFIWYRELVVLGARIHQLPDYYIHEFESCPAIADPKFRHALRENSGGACVGSKFLF